MHFLVKTREAVTSELFGKTGVVRMFDKFTGKSRITTQSKSS